MRTEVVSPGSVINLGYQYDNDAVQVVFPKSIIEQITNVYGTGGTFAIWYRRSGEPLGYPIGNPLVQYANDMVTWQITEAELANPGSAQVQLRYIVDEVCVMSQIYAGNVNDSVDIGSDVPEPMEAWADIIVKAVNGLAATGLSSDIKEALLDCFEHVAWIDEHGQDYVDTLYEALYPPKQLVSITAVYTQTGTIYDNDSLDDLEDDLVVTGHYDDLTTETIPATDYALSGTLNPGISTITVTCDGKTATFSVEVTHMPGTVTITNTLSHATNSNAAASATEGDSYSATISAASGYTLSGATVSITMGGTDITSTAYNNGTISIASLTGNLVITVTAVEVTLSSISAVYTQSGTVYDTDSLDSLKTDLVVTATYSDSSSETVASADYTLSGTLTVGTSTITVSYGGKTTTFSVTVTAELPSEYQKVEWVGAENTTDAPTVYVEVPDAIPSNTSVHIHAEMKPLENVGSYDSPIGAYAKVGETPNNARMYVYYNSQKTTITPYSANGVTLSNQTYDINTWDSVDFDLTSEAVLRFFMLTGLYNHYAFNGKIKSVKITNSSNVALYDLVPCYLKADNTIGFYDKVGGSFYTKSGTGSLIKGNDV